MTTHDTYPQNHNSPAAEAAPEPQDATQRQPGPQTLREMVVRVDSLPHGWQVAAVVLLGGAVAAISYGLAELQLLDLAATLLTAWTLSFARLVAAMRTPKRGEAFAQTRTMMRTVIEESRVFLAERKTLAKGIIALGSAVLFVACKGIAMWGLELLSNPWLAGGLGLIIASIVASPVIWRATIGTVGR